MYWLGFVGVETGSPALRQRFAVRRANVASGVRAHVSRWSPHPGCLTPKADAATSCFARIVRACVELCQAAAKGSALAC